MTRWTKKSIQEMRSQIDAVVLRYDLPGNLTSRSGAAERRAKLRAAIQEHRQSIVVGGLTGFRTMLEDRAKSQEETRDHYRAHTTLDPEDIVGERFEKLAKETRWSIQYIDRLIARIEAEGLPPEVVEYMPERILD